jgi:hypothetical protein
MSRLPLAVLVAAALLGACRDDEPAAPTRQELQQLMASGLGFTSTEATCLADRIVPSLGESGMRELGLLDGSTGVSPRVATALVDAFDHCADVSTAGARWLTAPFDVSRASVQCLGETVDDATMREFLEAAFEDPESSDSPAILDVGVAMQQCLTEAEMLAIAQSG